jgi:hypothetical protein
MLRPGGGTRAGGASPLGTQRKNLFVFASKFFRCRLPPQTGRDAGGNEAARSCAASNASKGTIMSVTPSPSPFKRFRVRFRSRVYQHVTVEAASPEAAVGAARVLYFGTDAEDPRFTPYDAHLFEAPVAEEIIAGEHTP